MISDGNESNDTKAPDTKRLADQIVSFTFDDYPDSDVVRNRNELIAHVAAMIAAALVDTTSGEDAKDLLKHVLTCAGSPADCDFCKEAADLCQN